MSQRDALGAGGATGQKGKEKEKEGESSVHRFGKYEFDTSQMLEKKRRCSPFNAKRISFFHGAEREAILNRSFRTPRIELPIASSSP